jgi:lipoprotein NlpD
VAGGAPILPSSPPLPPGTLPWRWPTAGNVAKRFAPDQNMKGIDIAGAVGQPILSSAAGKVVYSGNALKGYGELIIVKHGDEYLTAYGYNRRRLVAEGQEVAAGQAIAEMGTSPDGQPLLHFEIRDKGRPLDPLSLLPAR